MDCHIPACFGGGSGVGGCLGAVPTRVDEGFVGDSGGLPGLSAELVPFGCEVVVAG